MALHDNVKNRAFDFKGIYIFLAARRVKNNDFSQKSDEDGLRPFSYVARGKLVTMHYFEAPPEVFEEPEVMRLWVQKAYGAAKRAKKE